MSSPLALITGAGSCYAPRERSRRHSPPPGRRLPPWGTPPTRVPIKGRLSAGARGGARAWRTGAGRAAPGEVEALSAGWLAPSTRAPVSGVAPAIANAVHHVTGHR